MEEERGERETVKDFMMAAVETKFFCSETNALRERSQSLISTSILNWIKGSIFFTKKCKLDDPCYMEQKKSNE